MDKNTSKDQLLIAKVSGKRLIYDDCAKQSLSADGSTVYNEGRDSKGFWKVENGRFYSQWPPSTHWASYTLTDRIEDGKIVGVTFTGERGDSFSGVFTE